MIQKLLNLLPFRWNYRPLNQLRVCRVSGRIEYEDISGEWMQLENKSTEDASDERLEGNRSQFIER